MMKRILFILLFFSSILSAQTYQEANIFIEDSLKVGTSANSIWIDTIKAGSIVITYNGVDYTMDGVSIDYVAYDTTNWYWDENGNDANSGHHPDTAKQTMTALAALTPSAGDTIFVNGTWRLTTTLIFDDWVGTSSDQIALMELPGGEARFLGSDTITTWTDRGSNVWWGYKASLESFATGYIVFEEIDGTYTWGVPETSIDNLDTDYEYFYSNDTVYVRYTSDPATAFTSVEIPQQGHLIQLDDPTEYVSIDGLEIAYGIEGHGIFGGYPGNGALKGYEIRNNHIHHKGTFDDNSTGMDLLAGAVFHLFVMTATRQR